MQQLDHHSSEVNLPTLTRYVLCVLCIYCCYLFTEIHIVSYCKCFSLTDPSNVVVSFKPKERQVNVSLDNQEGRATDYVVQCRSFDNSDCGRHVSSRLTSFSFQSLSPYHNYSFTVVTKTTGPGVNSKTVQATYIQQTLQDGEFCLHTCHWLLPTVHIYVDMLQQCLLV